MVTTLHWAATSSLQTKLAPLVTHTSCCIRSCPPSCCYCRRPCCPLTCCYCRCFLQDLYNPIAASSYSSMEYEGPDMEEEEFFLGRRKHSESPQL